MTTTIIGYPHIGRHLELKSAVEAYHKQTISASELNRVAAQTRQQSWQTQAQAGIDWLPVNDFSYEDQLLDTAVLFNVIPQRFRQLHFSPLDTYFAMACGTQANTTFLSPLKMATWFNTHYGYFIPELEDPTTIQLVGTKPFDEFKEAQQLGYHARPTIIGPYTLLKLSRITSTKKITDYVNRLVTAYAQLFDRFDQLNADWLQLDEPALVLAPTKADLELFNQIYTTLLPQKGRLKILLQTAYGDVREAYSQLTQLNFDGLGLDFIDGQQTEACIQDKGFPDNKVLFAGIINGRNVWRTNYQTSLDLLHRLPVKHVVLSTSCSLLHLPISLANEPALPKTVRPYLAFAEEKLTDLVAINNLLAGRNPEFLTANQRLFNHSRGAENVQVTTRLHALTKVDYHRRPERKKRQRRQQQAIPLPVLPMTTIGSFPQTAADKQRVTAFKQGQLTKAQFQNATHKRLQECLTEQTKLGLDVLVTGEYSRDDMISYFDHQLSGFLFTKHAWIQTFGTYCAQPPIIWGDIAWTHPITVTETVAAQRLTTRPVKGVLTGPLTLVNWAYPREDVSLRISATQIALALQDEAHALEEHNIHIIQFDEPAFRSHLPLRQSDWYTNYFNWAIAVIRLVASHLQPTTRFHIHMCYQQYTDILDVLDQLDADALSLSATDPALLDALHNAHFATPVGLGMFDTAQFKVPTKAVMVAKLQAAIAQLGPTRIWVNPDCGLKLLDEPGALTGLARMVQATKQVRNTI
ncbi:5-methyltetrahydropteroyltriglutamate--homocysteine S-methyltransferase [Secundilactobacillus hailunensis]|uniref:5-methyltetrahydropteroyltriglutamate--homocysteine S-methyltransferase n=1 Tax=Secundilactobacillus hailunensis TaxID=2559923 RepID=A0ABW1TAV2_9LACO|nr:5-methyltetrahydropteroyltriglutamate--homocysteine S-methyltransferase [Secundilactobacillus hailunensis]